MTWTVPHQTPSHHDSRCVPCALVLYPVCFTGLRIAAHVPTPHAAFRGALPVGACPPAPLCRATQQCRRIISAHWWMCTGGAGESTGCCAGRAGVREAQGRARCVLREHAAERQASPVRRNERGRWAPRAVTLKLRMTVQKQGMSRRQILPLLCSC